MRNRDSNGGENSDVDYIFDIPVELAQALTGFRYDMAIEGAGKEPFEVLEKLYKKKKKKSFRFFQFLIQKEKIVTTMKPRISMITLGVNESQKIGRLLQEGWGFPQMDSPPEVAFFPLTAPGWACSAGKPSRRMQDFA